MTYPRTLNFKPWQRHKLLCLRDHDPRPYVRERSAALLKISEGHSPHWVAQRGRLNRATPTRSISGWIASQRKASMSLPPSAWGNRRISPLEAHRPELEERLRQAPAGTSPPTERIPHRTPLPPSRWSLIMVRQHFDWLADYCLSGVWQMLQRCEIEWKHGYVNHWSPDPDYARKVKRNQTCLKQAVSDPRHVVAPFLDEMGYYRWPSAARDWLPTENGYPRAEHGDCNNQQWRVIGALNAHTGQVSYLQNYIIGRAKVIDFYELLNRQYRHAESGLRIARQLERA